ncbi:bifunctional 2-C-methyl-D-erythritol 4-phosphate cytidylyltransferase/2-C-methyl-D-erythritol 2,4-cyclodiphosphate synthase [Qipengyuania spongiae]|uniref:Bifunctional enzyme IspD/IspF n=1 Tax=Qipengyuania spongiae TaxID=2909673 RepID=A0ABY5SWG1_9SPHN|nr:bifunctional 2-C-methyl-D-erythritol 4-phosphate cytidylyltransferase/2-C-methyl-D-erythritol 2,4-cyclodiphosphate synthase [Qipengyuania spongiae]UVI38892.1 bifunctional 2-C-methyl-D-erythritol 4-phosphate cytidylyltransferase/2-C-methyl-D-erythritol 2,4-cyclodiphosphate synthase [Qipengyuania spongiae]
MDEAAALPPFAAIVVAAGKGERARQGVPKQFAFWRGKPVLRHSVDALVESGANPVIVAAPSDMQGEAHAAVGDNPRVEVVAGGATRQASVRHSLDVLAGRGCERVLIHDAARPELMRDVVARLIKALETTAGAIPVLPVVDSLVIASSGAMDGKAEREAIRRVQTPQAFRFSAIHAAHHAWEGAANAGDDAQVLHAAGGSVALVDGDERLRKLTFAEDFMDDLPPMRIGSGYDVHCLAEGEELWLGGVRIEHSHGLSGHSDADVALHAIVDALLGSVGAGDIGTHFPPSDPQWKGAASDRFLTHAVGLVTAAGYSVGNVDLTIVCEAPKIGPHRDAMRERIAQLLGVDIGAVSVKATTTERLGFTGRQEGIAAQAVALVIRR